MIQSTSVVPLANHLVEAGRFQEAADLVREHASPMLRNQALAGTFVRWGQMRPEAVDSYIDEHAIAKDIVETYRERLAKKTVRVERRRRVGVSEDQG